MRSVAFFGVGTRGSATSVYEYASAAEELLSLSVHVILLKPDTRKDDPRLARTTLALFARRFEGRFSVLPCCWPPPSSAIDAILTKINATDLYIQKSGADDGVLSRLPMVRNLVHAVFDGREQHGYAYARISPSVPGTAPVVPYIVPSASATGSDLREELDLPRNATVFCRMGSEASFNIVFVHVAVIRVAAMRPDDVHFLLMNTRPFCNTRCPANIHHLPPISDTERKSSFIRTCDAMIHARAEGETFGLAIAEFTAHNRPVLTSSAHHDHGKARMHLDTLGTRGIYYHDEASLITQLLSFDRVAAAHADWRSYSAYDRHSVMRTFEHVFLQEGAVAAARRQRGALRRSDSVPASAYEMIASASECCGVRGIRAIPKAAPNGGAANRSVVNAAIKGMKGRFELPIDCEPECSASARCTHFSHSPRWRSCVLCDGCVLTQEGNARSYSSWRKVQTLA